MTVIVHVKHFLNPEGLSFFPQWFDRTGQILKQQEGFTSFRYAHDNQDPPACMNLWVEFESLEKLTKWGSSALHGKVVSELDSYRTKPYEATRYHIEKIVR